MKNAILLMVILFGLISCNEKIDKQEEQNKLYFSIIREMTVTMDQLGKYEYSPNGKDSIWEVSDFTYNVNLIEKVLEELEPISRKWDSLMFLAKKSDSIPYPTTKLFDSYERVIKRRNSIIERKGVSLKLIENGNYDRNGKKLR